MHLRFANDLHLDRCLQLQTPASGSDPFLKHRQALVSTRP